MSMFALDAEHLERQSAFSQATFGPGTRINGVLDHISKEIEEVRADPQDITEWADLLILALDGALRQGFDPQDILDAVQLKQIKNEGRTWPHWKDSDPNKAIEHIET